MFNLTNTDASDSIFLESQLKNIVPKAYEIQYPNLKAKEIFPVDYSDGDGVDLIEWKQYDARGMAKILASYAAKDIPRVDLSAKKNVIRVFPGGDSYGYSIDDIKKAQRNNTDLEAKKASIAQRANEELIERLAFKGDEDFGIKGILDQPNVPRFSALKNSNNKTLWQDKKPQEVLDDLYAMFNKITDVTNEMECPDSLGLAPAMFNKLTDTPYSERDSTRLMDVFKKSKPEIKNIYKIPHFAKAGTNGTDIAIFYERNEEKLSLKIPYETEHLPPQVNGLEYVIYTRLRVAGVVVFMPFSLLIGEGF